MSRLRSIARQLGVGQEQPPAPPPTAASGLGEALEALIDQQVEARMAAALERHRERVRPVPMPTPTPQASSASADAPRQMPPMRMIRDELGRVVTLAIGDQRVNVIRDEFGRASALVPAATAAPTPPTRQEQVVLDYEHSRDAPAPKPNLGLTSGRYDPVPDYEKSQR